MNVFPTTSVPHFDMAGFAWPIRFVHNWRHSRRSTVYETPYGRGHSIRLEVSEANYDECVRGRKEFYLTAKDGGKVKEEKPDMMAFAEIALRYQMRFLKEREGLRREVREQCGRRDLNVFVLG